MSKKTHTIVAQIIWRLNPVVWEAKCGRHAAWTGPSYEAVEDKWRQHVYEATGQAPEPAGDTTVSRWSPEGVDS